ncbi:MAG: 50S ribosomal protein L21 [Pelagibacteraceae bacterium]|jgi:large subunit ribosomal protein L21|nr:50S ribosomal protein L21 [Pelagibacteraceae bacterium]MDP6784310.1 50S ribosomal protein L21 [Alphaproteobacteria bacterium]MBO6466648.1 50S ribosomal protein L21 [Pelagibacteraceae bacterium]MBO6468035.1 50S ribosomal protein L21 [Pelagibacteraceae bacterium]MBO6468966.1 50S ribosomal protein L21 [Pelagibacteraceae bacterium]
MLAVIKTGGKQYAVKAGQILKVEKLDGKKGDSISFGNVLAVTDSSNHTIGNPLIKGASVEAKILDQIRDKKIIVFKKRRRKNSKSTQGHRQYLTVLQIESIMSGGKKSIALKKEIKVKKVDTKSKTLEKEESKKIEKKIEKKATPKKKVAKKTTTKKIIKKKSKRKK